jgi:signal transduction histidine kinase
MERTPLLIIDDEPGVLEGLTEFLEDEGYEIYQAPEGETGLNIFRKVKPALVVADLRMPGMPGLELIKEIRRSGEHTRIIVITGYGTLESAIDAIRLSVFDFIKKPIDLDYLKHSLDKAREDFKAEEEKPTVAEEQVDFFQDRCNDLCAKLSEVEPLIQAGKNFAGILHNLNNPLTCIMGQAELLKLFHPEIEDLDMIHKQAIRMKKIISATMKRIKQSQSRQTEPLQLNEILEEEVFFLESHPQLKLDLEQEWQLSPDLPKFQGVGADFSQVFGNILRNAAEAMKGQNIKRLTLRSWWDPSGIHISIQDTGVGIPPHLKEKIFQPFFSTKPAGTASHGGGMGMGLHYCKELITSYGGTLEVFSRPGRGTIFVLNLPIKPEQMQSDFK